MISRTIRAEAARLGALTVLALLAGAAVAGCATTGQVAPRMLTIEVASDPSGDRPMNLVIIPVVGEYGRPRGDPIPLGSVPPGDVGQFGFETDRLGGYQLLASEMPPPTTKGELESLRRSPAMMRQTLEARLGDHSWSRVFWINDRTDRVAWDIGTDVLRLMEDEPAG